MGEPLGRRDRERDDDRKHGQREGGGRALASCVEVAEARPDERQDGGDVR